MLIRVIQWSPPSFAAEPVEHILLLTRLMSVDKICLK